MPAKINLSKNWTHKQVFGTLRTLSNSLTKDEVNNDTLNDFVYLAICSVVEILGPAAYGDYGATKAITSASDIVNDIYDLIGLNLDNVIKVADTTNGLYKQVPLKELDGFHSDIPTNAKIIAFAKHGQSLIFAKGTNSYAATVNLYHTRMPTKADISDDVNLDDTLDILDKYVDLVIRKAKVSIYEMLNKSVPETLQNSVDSSTERIRNANLAEMAALKANE